MLSNKSGIPFSAPIRRSERGRGYSLSFTGGWVRKVRDAECQPGESQICRVSDRQVLGVASVVAL